MGNRLRRLAGIAALLALAAAPDSPAAAGARAERAATGAPAEGVSVSPAEVAARVRAHELTLLDGRRASAAVRPGEVVVLNFWATWCRPCLRELPALARLHREIAPRGGRVVAVSIDAERRNVERFTRAHDLDLPVAHDGPSGLARRLDLRAVPLTLVLDRSGTLAWASTRTDEAGLAATRAAVLRLLDAPAPPALAGEAEGSR